MDAEVVWRTWRRILQEPSLAHDVFEADEHALETRWHLNQEEMAVALAYASACDRSRWAVETYRYRLVSAVLNALELGAPLTRRRLEFAGIDLRELAAGFLDRTGWHDHGPFVYFICSEFLTMVASTPDLNVSDLDDLLRLEHAAVDLIRSRASDGQVAVPDRSLPLHHGLLKHTGNGVIVHSAKRLSAWLEDPRRIGIEPLEGGREIYLVFVRRDSERCGLMQLEPRALAAYELFQTQHATATVAQELKVTDADRAELEGLIHSLLDAGVIATS